MKCERCGKNSLRDQLHDYCNICSQNLCEKCMAEGCCGKVPAVSGSTSDSEAHEEFEKEKAKADADPFMRPVDPMDISWRPHWDTPEACTPARDLFLFPENIYERLLTQCVWVNRDAPRDECFMANEDLEYTYSGRTYKSGPFHSDVRMIMKFLNGEFKTTYNVCFLNYYKDERQSLGWHADDSPEMDLNHPIAVVSFGAERQIWVKKKGESGIVPPHNRYTLTDGSLFIMPAGYQREHLHRIPKHDRPCGGRISLTFRHFVKPEVKA